MQDSTTTDCLADGFRNLDRQSDIEKFTRCLTFIDQLPTFKAYKAEIDRELSFCRGGSLIDMGCGLGFDVERLSEQIGPHGHVVGLDSSQALIREARRRVGERSSTNVHWVLSDAQNVPFPDNHFDAARVDRTLQHVANPARVLGEMVRVIRPGGKVVCAEPDWGTFIVEDDDLEAVAALSDAWCGRFRHRYIGRKLGRMMAEAGLKAIDVRGHLLMANGLHAGNLVFDIETTCRDLSAKAEDARLLSWYEGLQARDRTSPVFSSVTLFRVVGVKP